MKFFWRPGVREKLERDTNLVSGMWPNWDHLQCGVPLTPELIDVAQVSTRLSLKLCLKDPLPMTSVLGLAWVARMEQIVEKADDAEKKADVTLQSLQQPTESEGGSSIPPVSVTSEISGH